MDALSTFIRSRPTCSARALSLGLWLGAVVGLGCAPGSQAHERVRSATPAIASAAASSRALLEPVEVPQALRDAHDPARPPVPRSARRAQRHDGPRDRGAPPPIALGVYPPPPTPPRHPALIGALMPLPEERLAKPIELAGCPEVRIIEWKDSGVLHVTSKPHPKLVAELGALCRSVVDELDRRMAVAGVTMPVVAPLRLTMSVIPPGRGPRELNDEEGRMRVEGSVRGLTLVGSYWGSFRHAFIHNGVGEQDGRGGLTLAMDARRVFAHELFHAFVHQRGVRWHFEAEGGEELHARKFTESLGFGE